MRYRSTAVKREEEEISSFLLEMSEKVAKIRKPTRLPMAAYQPSAALR
jgi:hypothetical protein